MGPGMREIHAIGNMKIISTILLVSVDEGNGASSKMLMTISNNWSRPAMSENHARAFGD